MPKKRQPPDPILAELRDYLNLSYDSEATVAAGIGVASTSLSEWLVGKSSPSPESVRKIRIFLEDLPDSQANGLAPVGFNHRPAPHLNSVPRPRRCPFCGKMRGEIRKVRSGTFRGVCPNCGASGPKQDRYDDALQAWNGRKPGP